MAHRTISKEIPFLESFDALRRLVHLPAPVLLDSALPHERLGRYAFAAADPFLLMTSKDGEIALNGETQRGDPFDVLRSLLARYVLPADPTLPPFQGGAVGYLGYDLVHHLETVPRTAVDDLKFPDLALGFYDVGVAFDVLDKRAWIVSTGFPEAAHGARQGRANERLAQMQGWLAQEAEPLGDFLPEHVSSLQANFTRPDYEQAVQRVIDYIYAGDIFQANLAQRFAADLAPGFDPLALYARLRAVNPAPFGAFLRLDDVVILSASPERFLKVGDGHVETRPIKGTRPRGAHLAEDAALREELLRSEKDRAENVMIVDLLRNDLSRVCADHSVRAAEICALESYASVHHLVSTVEGQLRPEMDRIDLLRATLPGGSITGAPKMRAMAIIDELEPHQRGPYCGCIGYLGFDGQMDMNIAIRTITVKGKKLCFQVGGGVVSDSDPVAEYEETLTKACGLLAALGQGLPAGAV